MLEIYLRRVHQVAILDLSGSLDIDSSVLVEKVGWCIENGFKDLLCNFENVNVVDYAGLSAVAIAYKNVINHKGRMKFVNVPMHIKKVFNLVCLDRVFEVYEDEKWAVKSFEEDKELLKIQEQKLRRRFRRLALDVEIEIKAKNEDSYRRAKLLNLSAVGMLVFAEKIYSLGEKMDVRLSLKPVAEKVEVSARVSWLVDKKIQPQIYPGMGLEFCHLDAKMQEKIIEYVERNLPLDTGSRDLN